jgi:hypothetical protein
LTGHNCPFRSANVIGRPKDRRSVNGQGESILQELEDARVLVMSLEQPNAAVAASMGKAKVAGKIVQRYEHGQPGAFAELNDEELQQAILEQTRELAELDPEFAKQLAQPARACAPEGSRVRSAHSMLALRHEHHGADSAPGRWSIKSARPAGVFFLMSLAPVVAAMLA